MISSVLGAAIISVATAAMLIAIQISDAALNNAGKHPLTNEEERMARRIGNVDEIDIRDLNSTVMNLKVLSDQD